MFNAGFNPYSAVAKEGLFSALKTKINELKKDILED